MKPINCLILTLAVAATPALAEVGPDEIQYTQTLQITDSLTGSPGDPVAGRKVFADRKLGNCLACHANSDQSEHLFHGEVGPSLNGVGNRYSEGLLRTLVVNAKKLFGERSVMPGFYSNAQGARVAEKFAGKTILTAQQAEDVVAYLTTLK